MVLNATFKNISVISCRSVLLVGETGVPRENHRPVACHWQTLSHNVASSTLRYERDSNGTHSFSAHNGISLLVVALYCAPEDSLSFLRRRMCYPVPWLCPFCCHVCRLNTIWIFYIYLMIQFTWYQAPPRMSCCFCMFFIFRFEIHWCGVVNPFLWFLIIIIFTYISDLVSSMHFLYVKIQTIWEAK